MQHPLLWGIMNDIPLSQLVAEMKETSVMSIAGYWLKDALKKGARKRDIDCWKWNLCSGESCGSSAVRAERVNMLLYI